MTINKNKYPYIPLSTLFPETQETQEIIPSTVIDSILHTYNETPESTATIHHLLSQNYSPDEILNDTLAIQLIRLEHWLKWEKEIDTPTDQVQRILEHITDIANLKHKISTIETADTALLDLIEEIEDA